MPLVPVGLASLALCSTLMGADAPSPSPGQHYDEETIVKLVLHSLQVVVQLSLLLVELVVSQHIASLLRGEPDPMLQPLKPEKGGKKPNLDAGGRAILMAPSRWRMAMSAFKYVLPDNRPQKLRLLACFVMVATERGVNLAVPVLFKQMVDQLSQVDALKAALRILNEAMAAGGGSTLLSGMLQAGKASFWSIFYPSVFFYLGFYFLRGGSGADGLMANIRDLLWIPITQAAYRRISLDVFGHLLDLDHHFHLKRKTGQIMRILDRGTSSIQDTVSIVLFNVLPQIADIVVACTYLAIAMKPWAATIVFITVASYIPLTVVITERRGKIRKRMNALDNAREGRATDMLLNYETVKFFCNEALELNGYDSALRQYQAAEYWQMAFLAMLSIVQGSVVWLGLVSGMVVCVQGVADGTLTIGDTVLFVTMINQLYIPLTFFGSYYRQVQKALIDMENMFELIHTKPKVQDPPSGAKLQVVSGEVTFSNVVFGYKPNYPPVLKGVSFHVPGGKTLAVVGSTGSGKSTILRLLLRFYDVNDGAVLIDGQDVRRVTQHSLRSAIAVVPQDTVLFNDTVLHNIRYGRIAASDAEVYEAAQVAHIHESIVTRFKKGYETKVGERGLKLSGGEKQRVAFARAVLKNPAILVLDEATSALDSITEQAIQSSLAEMRSHCTTVIVAHRLSTIMDADMILVLDRGHVAQCGSHAELIEQGGLYAQMWTRQKQTMEDEIASPLIEEVRDEEEQEDTDDEGSVTGAADIGADTDAGAPSPSCATAHSRPPRGSRRSAPSGPPPASRFRPLGHGSGPGAARTSNGGANAELQSQFSSDGGAGDEEAEVPRTGEAAFWRVDSVDNLTRHPSPNRLRIMSRLGVRTQNPASDDDEDSQAEENEEGQQQQQQQQSDLTRPLLQGKSSGGYKPKFRDIEEGQ